MILVGLCPGSPGRDLFLLFHYLPCGIAKPVYFLKNPRIVTGKIKKHLSADPVMKALLQTVTVEIPERPGNIYEALLRAIVGQQLSGKAATTIYGRFLERYDGVVPEPAVLRSEEIEDLRSVGLSRQKASYLQNVAAYFETNSHLTADFHDLSDEEIIEQLTSIKGVGKWTVEMILMFTLNRPDVFPVDDLGIRNAIQKHYALTAEGRELKRKMLEIAEQWRPYRSYASFVLWRSLDQQ